MERVTGAELVQRLKALPKWKIEDGALVREMQFADFADAMQFVNRVAEAAEAARHHPDIDIRYNRVRLGLVTHDAGGITENDVKMAAQLDTIAG